MANKKSTARNNKLAGSIPKLTIDRDSNVEIRKIENGFIVRESGTIGKGRTQQYYNKEYFSAKNPVAGVITKSTGAGSVKFGKK